MLQERSSPSVAEGSPMKRRRGARPQHIQNEAASPNVLFDDRSLLEIESTPSQSQLPPQPRPSRSMIDENGWVAIDKSETGHNCIQMDRSALHTSTAPQVQVSRRTALKFDDPNPSHQRSNPVTSSLTSHQPVAYPPAVVIEMDFQMKSHHNRPTLGTTSAARHPRDQRCFHKNVVRTLCEEARGASSSSGANRLILKKKDMDKVLPKESERELLVRYLGLLLLIPLSLSLI
jgi:hypothetical protein